MAVFMISFIFETYLIVMNSSHSLQKDLIFIYLVIYGILEIIYTIIINRKIEPIKNRSSSLKNKKGRFNLYKTIIEAVFHGTIIALSVILTLPHIRLERGKLLCG